MPGHLAAYTTTTTTFNSPLSRKTRVSQYQTGKTTARVLASQAEVIVRTGKHGHNIE